MSQPFGAGYRASLSHILGDRYGFFSAEAAYQFGTIVWLDIEGKEVHVTGVYTDEVAENYKWKDKVCLGKVDKWVREGYRGNCSDLMDIFDDLVDYEDYEDRYGYDAYDESDPCVR